jgi:hypothetical protein
MTDVKQQDNALQPTERSSNEYANKCTVMPNYSKATIPIQPKKLEGLQSPEPKITNAKATKC